MIRCAAITTLDPNSTSSRPPPAADDERSLPAFAGKVAAISVSFDVVLARSSRARNSKERGSMRSARAMRAQPVELGGVQVALGARGARVGGERKLPRRAIDIA